MVSRIPPASPASTMLVVRSSKILGYWRMALESVEPPSTLCRTPVRHFWKIWFSWLAARISRHCTSGKPASIITENCRKKTAVSLMGTLPVPKVGRANSLPFSLMAPGVIRSRRSCMVTAALLSANRSPAILLPWGSVPVNVNAGITQFSSRPVCLPAFTGTGPQGKRIAGERLADSKAAVTMQLRRERITPGAIKEKGKEFVLPTFGTGKVPIKDTAVFFRQFSVMIDAGLPLVQCLEILAANQENQIFQKCLTGVRQSVEGGSTLSNAMRQYPKIFDDLTTNMVEAGEAGGILDTILQRLATYVEKAV